MKSSPDSSSPQVAVDAPNRIRDNTLPDYFANKPGPIPEEDDSDQALLDAIKKGIESIEPPKGLKEAILKGERLPR